MTYTRQTWQDGNGAYPVSAARMIVIEQGVRDSHYMPWAICTRSTAPGTILTNAAYTSIPFESVTYSSADWPGGAAVPWAVANATRLVIPVTGTYIVQGAFVYASGTGTGSRSIALRVNGAANPFQHEFLGVAIGSSGFTASRQIAALRRFTVNDYIELQAWQDSGAALNLSLSECAPTFSFTLLAY